MHGGRHGGDRMLMGGLRQLDLTDAQREQIKQIVETNKSTNPGQRDEMRGLIEKKRDGSITEQEKVRLREIKTQMKASGEQIRTSVLAILTPEQRTQLEKSREEMRQRKEERKQMRRDNRNSDKTDKSDDN